MTIIQRTVNNFQRNRVVICEITCELQSQMNSLLTYTFYHYLKLLKALDFETCFHLKQKNKAEIILFINLKMKS